MFRFVQLVSCGFLIQISSLFAQTSSISLVEAFPNLRFQSPVFLTHSNDGSNRIFVVEQDGVIRVFPNDPAVATSTVFLDIDARVASGGEMGLLGLAFHPDYASNGFFYVNYTAGSGGSRRTVISRFSVNPNDPDRANSGSELILLEFSQPFSNHNGGMIQFGPGDGYLYIATGDGGNAGDPLDNGQKRTTLLGKILRIDVDNPATGLNYGIPADNPFAGNNQGFREEIWAYGLRNPWRFSIDPVTDQLWAGDVGQNRREEIDLIERGGNYGWRIMEGNLCFNPSSNCNMSGLILPIKDYGRNEGISVTGGYVYRGSLQPKLDGAYIYGDFGSGRMWLLRYENQQITADSLLLATGFNISSFGVDENNELYVIDYSGVIYRFNEDPTTGIDDAPQPKTFALHQNFPNPFNPATTIRFTLATAGRVELTVYDALGNHVKTLLQGELEPGSHAIIWDGTDESNRSVASGIYFYQLRLDRFKQTKKMILIR